MCSALPLLAFLVIATTASAKDGEPELPLCPTNIQYFPQTLPMHCRMPVNSPLRSLQNIQNFPGMPKLPNMPTPYPPPFYQSPSPDKVPPPLPYPMPPGFPAPIFPPIISQPQQPHKLPVIVMPFYSPDKTFHDEKKPDRPSINKPSDTDGDDDKSCDTDMSGTDKSDDSSGGGVSSSGWWKPKKKNYRNYRRSGSRRSGSKRRKHGRKDLLTPLIQYVTKDGYVIFEKEISKSEATDWLNDNNKNDDEIYDEEGEGDGNGEGEVMNNVDEPEAPRVEMLQQGTRRMQKDIEQPKEKRYQEMTTTERSSTRRHRSKLRDILKEQRRQVRVVAAQDP
ncbi:PHD finger protein 3-like [Pectinophora gossypiella]|uniref:PHD finger protein 3-like n=1 Tax=Pectinophora gossypiella TaxID=13191 RepID=UPI00214F151E|nr:PHD finger protein 3-like [Pectinophora gossypiella]